MLCEATGPSSQTTFSDLRALFASHQLSATMATPEAHATFGPAGAPAAGAGRGAGASIMKACFTPDSFLISSKFALTALPPNTGHFS